MNIEVSPQQIAALRRYEEPFRRLPHPVVAHFPGGTDPVFPCDPESDRGLGLLLLVAALHRPGGEAAAVRLVAGLYRTRGNDVFRLNRSPFEPLRDEVEALAPDMDPAERARVPGILRSVCDFFFRTGPLGAWMNGAPDWEPLVETLGREVYWMGARSRMRTKVRLFFWLARAVPDARRALESEDETRPRPASAFAWPVGEGHMRFLLDIIKPARGRIDRAPEARLAAFAALARTVFPEAPWRLYRPLDAFLARDGRGGYVCRAAQGGCRPCAFAAVCPAAGHFLPGEP